MSPFREALTNGAFTIDQIVNALHDDGYIMEGRSDLGAAISSTIVDSIASDFVDYCRENKVPIQDDIKLQATATTDGDFEGCHRYVVYNINRFSHAEAKRMLVKANTEDRKRRITALKR